MSAEFYILFSSIIIKDYYIKTIDIHEYILIKTKIIVSIE